MSAVLPDHTEALVENSLVAAIAAYSTALRRRANLWQEIANAQMRLGPDARNVLGPRPPDTRSEVTDADLASMIMRTADQITTDRVSAEAPDPA